VTCGSPPIAAISPRGTTISASFAALSNKRRSRVQAVDGRGGIGGRLGVDSVAEIFKRVVGFVEWLKGPRASRLETTSLRPPLYFFITPP
jgi:hypothetical protein